MNAEILPSKDIPQWAAQKSNTDLECWLLDIESWFHACKDKEVMKFYSSMFNDIEEELIRRGVNVQEVV